MEIETNILGLPSLTGFTPLKSSMEDQVLKYDFKGVGPSVIDKSLKGNKGTLKPNWPKNSPKRKVSSFLPFKVALIFDGEDDYLVTPHSRSLDWGEELSVEMEIYLSKWSGGYFFNKGHYWKDGYGYRIYEDKETFELFFNDSKGNHAIDFSRYFDLETAEWMRIGHSMKQGEKVKVFLGDDVVETDIVLGEPINSTVNLHIGSAWPGRFFVPSYFRKVTIWNKSIV